MEINPAAQIWCCQLETLPRLLAVGNNVGDDYVLDLRGRSDSDKGADPSAGTCKTRIARARNFPDGVSEYEVVARWESIEAKAAFGIRRRFPTPAPSLQLMR
jgi:hypothetical protein